MASAFEIFDHYCRSIGYPIVFGGVLLESAGIPLPGETALLAGGFLASEAGGGYFDIRVVILGTMLAAVIGDNISYFLGRHFARARLLKGKRFLFLTPSAFHAAERYFRHYGMWTVFFARFVAALRVIGALAAGTGGMSWPRFLIANICGAATWATVIGLLGYHFGKHWRTLDTWLGRGGLIIVAVGAIATFVYWHHVRPRWIVNVEPEDAGPKNLSSETAVSFIQGSTRMPEKVVIIGSGPAGWTAAIYAARANLQPLVFEGAIREENRLKGTLPLGQLALTTEVENYPGFPAGKSQAYLKSALPPERQPYWVQENKEQPSEGVNGPEMMELMRQQAVNFGTRIITDDIVKVDFKRHPFQLTALEGQTVEALAVIVATGARANYLGLPSEDRFKNHGVSACAVCDGALPRFRNKPVIVIGGGDSAVEEGTYLTKFASKVYMIHRRDALRASKIMQQRALANTKIEIKWNRSLAEVLGTDKEGVTGVRLSSTTDDKTEELSGTGVFLAIGHTPNTDFLEGQLDLDEKGYIRWTKPQRTNTTVDGVFAAGDVADSYYRQAVTAAGTGCMAALDAERWLAEKGHH